MTARQRYRHLRTAVNSNFKIPKWNLVDKQQKVSRFRFACRGGVVVCVPRGPIVPAQCVIVEFVEARTMHSIKRTEAIRLSQSWKEVLFGRVKWSVFISALDPEKIAKRPGYPNLQKYSRLFEWNARFWSQRWILVAPWIERLCTNESNWR